jgi:plastocyanin
VNIQPLLDFLTPIVVPDWGSLIALIPIGLLLVVLLWLALTLRAFASAGPTRRAPARLKPIPPPTIHMPGGSASPILAAFGAFSLLASLIIGGPAVLVGLVILVVTLLLWGREAMRDYQHLEPATILPAVVHEGPPPGVHMPGPSIRPLLGAMGTAALFGGLVIGGWVLIVAVIFLIWTLLGWLTDFSAEYRKVEEADQTGHLENIPARRWPKAALQLFVVAFVVVAIAQSGVVSKLGAAAGGPGASGSAPASGAPGGAGPVADLTVVAKDVAFDTHDLSIAGGKTFTIDFKNQDDGVPHNIEIKDASGSIIQDQPTVTGVKETVYTFDALKPGTYTFICKVHPIPSMTGTLTVK